MSDLTPEQALTGLLGTLVREHVDTDLFAELVRECSTLISADAVALLVDDGRGSLELLSATSHRAAELELYQVQQGGGPCVDAVRAARHLTAVGATTIVERWAEVGEAIVRAGFFGVHAFPMVWQGHALGGLNIFTRAPAELTDESARIAQNFADVATLALVQPRRLSAEELARRVSEALEGRVVIEQAKGVLAQTMGIDTAAAYDELVDRAAGEQSTPSEVARQVIDEASQR